MKTNIVRTFNRSKLTLKKYSPEILLVTGLVSGVAATVMACKETTKIDAILEERKANHEKVEYGLAEAEAGRMEYTPEEAKADDRKYAVKAMTSVVKLYAPSVALGTLSIACILGSYGILKKRWVASAAAYAAVSQSFNEYRNRVVARFGKDVDTQLKYNVQETEVVETVIDKKGKEKTVTKKITNVSSDDISQYAVIFNSNSRCWEKNREYNRSFLRSQESLANDILVRNGHLFLNEVYDMLDVPRTQAGQVVGWVYDPKNPEGDNYVQFFGIDECGAVDGDDKAILLDFNVDGYVLEKI